MYRRWDWHPISYHEKLGDFVFYEFLPAQSAFGYVGYIRVAWQTGSFTQTQSYSAGRFPINMLCQPAVETARVLAAVSGFVVT